MSRIVAIETSCDETGVAVMEKSEQTLSVVSSRLASQTDIHSHTGGVIPRVAAREHERVLEPLLQEVLAESGTTADNLDAVAVTAGPGLAPALLVGIRTARALAEQWKKPVIAVNHLEGHIYSALLEAEKSQIPSTKYHIPNDPFPALALIVSGGHTLLALITDHLQYTVLGSTRDDAAGEAFDKVARLLDLGYPGGPPLAALAATGSPTAYAFARPMLHSGDFDFSFSGLKTNVLYTLRDMKADLSAVAEQSEVKADIAASFEAAAVDVLAAKTQAAIEAVHPTISCDEARGGCTPAFVFSVPGQVRFRTALHHLTTCNKQECRQLRGRVIAGMQQKLEWLFSQESLLGCIHIQPLLYGAKRISMKRREFPTLAHHLAHCPKESCAQLRRALLLKIRDRVRPPVE